MMCLGMWHGQVGYDELRRRVKDEDARYNLDANVIEKKSTGISLIKDLRHAIPSKIRGYDPGTGGMLGHRGEDKISRAHAASPLFESGCIYIPDREWADLLINYVAAFPNGAPPSADLTDTCTMAVIYLKNGHWVNHPDDDDPPDPISNRDEDDEAAYQEDNQETDEGIYG